MNSRFQNFVVFMLCLIALISFVGELNAKYNSRRIMQQLDKIEACVVEYRPVSNVRCK